MRPPLLAPGAARPWSWPPGPEGRSLKRCDGLDGHDRPKLRQLSPACAGQLTPQQLRPLASKTRALRQASSWTVMKTHDPVDRKGALHACTCLNAATLSTRFTLDQKPRHTESRQACMHTGGAGRSFWLAPFGTTAPWARPSLPVALARCVMPCHAAAT